MNLLTANRQLPVAGSTKLKITLLIALFAVISLSYFIYEAKHRQTLSKIDGLKVESLQKGSGAVSTGEGLHVINYRGLLENGVEFAEKSTFQFRFGDGTVLKIWEDGIMGMKIGEVRRLEIVPALAYGSEGIPGIVPKNSTVIFEIELVEISK